MINDDSVPQVEKIVPEVIENRLFAGVVADEIIACIEEAVSERGKAVIALAGGKTPASVYRCLSLPPRSNQIPWDKVHLFLGDERWISRDDKQSNVRMVEETLLDNLKNKCPKLYGLSFDSPSPELAAELYEAELHKVLGDNGCLDVVLLGLGEDGHTASLFPGDPAVHEEKRLVVAVSHPNGGMRVTLTSPVLRRAREMLFLVTGENKAEIVKRVIKDSGSISELPARIYRKAEGQVRWFLDSSAALKVSAHD